VTREHPAHKVLLVKQGNPELLVDPVDGERTDALEQLEMLEPKDRTEKQDLWVKTEFPERGETTEKSEIRDSVAQTVQSVHQEKSVRTVVRAVVVTVEMMVQLEQPD